MIPCGSRTRAFKNFQLALDSHPQALNILLVDAEAPVEMPPWDHLSLRDNWQKPDVEDTCCYLMAQAMEAWFIGDVEALKQFYGQKFREKVIPRNRNVETIDKDRLESSLKDASRDTSKGEYQKIQHASKLLELVDVTTVRRAAPHCDTLFTTLTTLMEASP